MTDFEGPEVQELFPQVRIEDTSVFRLAEGVLVLDDAAEANTSYVLVDGGIRFVIDHLTHADWLRLLRGFDGRRPLSEALAAAGCELDAMRPLLDGSLEAGLLETVDSA